MPSASSHPTLRQTLTGLLKVLAAAGVPGASLAEDAVNAVANRLDGKRAWEALHDELARAEQAFLREAEGRGWRDLAQAITQLPLHDLPALETALRLALAQGDPAPLQAELERQLARLPGVEHPRLAAEAARRYAAHILDAAWGLPAFRDAVRDVLFREQDRALHRVEAAIQRLARWWRLVPAVQHLPREALLHEGDITLAALKAPLRVVLFTGKAHHALRDELMRWALDLDQASYRAGVRVVYGPGGSGKTRIAVETAQELEKHGWRRFFIPSEILRQVQEAQVHVRGEARGWFTPLRPTLYILDYSESLPDVTLQALMDTLYETAGERAFPVALLLLRRPPPDEALLQALAPATGEDASRIAFRQQVVRPALTAPRPAPRMEDRDDLLTLFQAARKAFVDLRGQAPEVEVTYRPEDLPDRALAVVLLGLLAAYGQRVARSAHAAHVLEDVWRWERSKWTQTLEKARAFREDEEKVEALARVEQAQVAATLGRPFFRGQDLVAFWKQVDDAGLLDDRDLRRLVRHLPRIFPRAGEDAPLVPPIAPDPLADFVLARHKDLEALARAALPTAEALSQAMRETRRLIEQGETDLMPATLAPLVWPLHLVQEVLPRLWEAYPEAAARLSRVVAEWLQAAALTLHRQNPEAADFWLALWDEVLPDSERTLALREVVAAYHRARAALAQKDEERALWQNNLSVALSALGRREEALEAAQEAVAIRRRLAQANPQAFLPDLAGSLNNLANILAALGRRNEALQAVKETVAIHRGLAQTSPQAFEPYLAGSLNNLAAFLSYLGRREEALEAAQEATALYRGLARANPQAFEPDLAMSLNNLANRLAALGRREEDLEVAREAAALYRGLAGANPQAFEPYLAGSLNNLARSLADLGRGEEALAAAQEAADLYRGLAQANPQAFLPDLAHSLGTLGTVLLSLGRAQEAAGAFAEAAHTLLPHARALPQAFGPLLAALVQSYLQACRTAGITPDADLMQEVASLVGTPILPAVARLAPLLLAVAALARGQGDEALQARVREALEEMQRTQDGQALATALQRLLAGERDPQALTAGLHLDETDAQALALALAAATTDEGWQALVALVEGVRR